MPSNPDSTLTAASAAAAVLALFVSLYSLYFTHQATGLREYRKWVREAALPLLAKLHETTIRLLREEERVSLMLHVRIRKSPTDEDRQQFAEMQKSLDVLLFDFRTTSLQLLFLAGRKLRPLLTSQRKYVEELGTATDYDDETDLRESIRKTDVAILEAAAADLGLTGALIRPRHEGFFISAGR